MIWTNLKKRGINMGKKLTLWLSALVVMGLAGCATTPNALNSLTAPQQAFINGCYSYNSLIVFLTQEATLKKLSAGQVATVNQVRQVAEPICSSPMPANPTQATSEVLSGVSKLGAVKNSISNPVTPTGK